MQQLVTNILEGFGYWGVLFLIAVENLFPPIPSEVILTFGGFLTTYTRLTVFGVITFSTIGSLAGALVLYAVGRKLGLEGICRLLSGRAGRLLKTDADDVTRAVKRFQEKGWPSIFYLRCVPILRSLISIPAGIAGMPLLPFILLTTAGSIVWNTLLVCLGAFAGARWQSVAAVFSQMGDAVKLALIVTLFAFCVYHIFQKIRKKDIIKDTPPRSSK